MNLADDFAEFYASYPRHIGRMDAEKAYTQMRRKGVSHERIMDGVRRYLEHLPEEAKFIPYPASWLRAGRFDDEYEVARPAAEYWYDECQRMHGGTCDKRWTHEMLKREQREAV